jgi:hypothetical protein
MNDKITTDIWYKILLGPICGQWCLCNERPAPHADRAAAAASSALRAWGTLNYVGSFS